jgi:diguanylate cyclase (GGDEF)-like protein/PAS domain S-box-containing protein
MTRPPSSPLSILLVEPDAAYVRVARATLATSREAWSLEHVGALQAGLDLLASGSFDALLLALDLPDIQGLEALRRVLARFPALPVVVLVAWDTEPLGLEALQQGAQDYIVKQEEEKRLAKALRFAVERKRKVDTLRQLEKAVETTQLGITVTDLQGRIVYVNPAEAGMHGYEAAEMLGMDARSLSPRAEWHPLTPEEMAGLSTWKRERVRSRKDGSTFPVQLMSDVVKDESGRPLGVVTTCEDITERRRAEQALRDSEGRYALAVRGANDGIWDWSLPEDRLYLSPRWKQMLGYADDEMSQASEEWFSRLHPEDAPRVLQKLAAHLEGTAPHFEDEHRIRHRDGHYLWVVARGFTLRDDQGRAMRIAGAQTDVTDRRAHDPLTGLANRALTAERLEQALARYHRRHEDAFAVLFVDIDHFKTVNDTLGHAAGDAVLMDVARRLESCLRPGDAVGRLAGDEFSVLLEQAADVDEAMQVAERMQHALREPLYWDGYPVRLSASIGIALSSTGYESAEQILGEADAAMYRAKASGRGRCVIFDAAMRERLRWRQRLVDGLGRALRHDELRLCYQPIVALDDACLLALEALLRWEHPDGRHLSPPEILALAEQTGQLPRIESWTLREACRNARAWREKGGQRVPVVVNVSPRQFRRADLAEEVLAIVREEGLLPSDLWLDVTAACLADTATAGSLVTALRGAGVRLFLDDFGTGESPLAPLARCPLDAIKLDPALVQELRSNQQPPLLMAALAVARSLGLPVLAEGVETADQRERLLQLGCALGQGELFAAPLSADDALAFVSATAPPARPAAARPSGRPGSGGRRRRRGARAAVPRPGSRP